MIEKKKTKKLSFAQQMDSLITYFDRLLSIIENQNQAINLLTIRIGILENKNNHAYLQSQMEDKKQQKKS